MKILAIRGQNLASLGRPFLLDLTAEPLAGSGLFAITGETGSGKSTILDALCLALYNKYPRVAVPARREESLPDPGGDALPITDPRAILRRGAAAGFAEVDFLGQDGVEYRARWSVARAHGKADGRLGEVTRKLTLRADGTSVAAGKTNVAREIDRCTDLTFDQFRRTVLLAQGEFDTFLLADEGDRAALLEKVTGTQIYGEISKQVRDQTSTLRRSMEVLEQRRQEIGLLTPEARMAHQEVETAHRRNIEDQQFKRNRWLADLQVREKIAAARVSLEGARQAQAGADARKVAALPDSLRLQELDVVEPLRSTQALALVATAALPRANTAQVNAAAELALQAEAKQVAHVQHEEAIRDADAAETVFKNFGPLWTEAEQLDALLLRAQEDWTARKREAEQAALVTAQQELAAGHLHTQLRSKRADLDAKEQQLQQRSQDSLLDQQFETVKSLVERYGAQSQLFTNRAGELFKAQEALADLEKAAEQEQATVDSGESLRSTRLAEAELLRAVLAKTDEPALQAAEASLAKLLAGLREAATLAREHEQAAQKRNAAEEKQNTASTACDRARDLAQTAEAVQITQQETRSRLLPLDELAQRSVSEQAEHLRSFMLEGEECPVCGAVEHPYRENEALRELAEDLRAQRQAADDAIALATRQSVQAAGELARAEARLLEAQASIEEANSTLDSAATRFLSILPEVQASVLRFHLASPLPRVLDSAASALLQGLIQETAAAQEISSSAINDARGVRLQLEQANHTVDQARNIVEKARAELDRITRLRVPAEKEAERLLGLADRATTDLAGIEVDLAPFLSVVSVSMDSLRTSSTKVLQTIETRALAYRTLFQQAEQLRTQIAELISAIGITDAGVIHAKQAQQFADSAVQDRYSDLSRLQSDRVVLLDGESTTIHRTRFNSARLAASEALRIAAEGAARAESAHSGAGSALQAASASVIDAERAATSTQRAFEQSCVAINRTPEAVAGILAASPESRQSLREQLATIDRALVAADAELLSRTQDLNQALVGVDEAVTRETLRGLLAATDADLSTEQQALGTVVDALRRDGEAQLQAEALTAEIDEQRAVLRDWDAVDDAIGSSDGTRFRQFVQGITLAHLTTLANDHLATLGPRYGLLQGRTSDLAVHILDRDMDDQVRSSRSLSGGERFLVSLSLALALSGLEGKSSFVDTLFIDEGFGSLDRETLDTAVDALERLHSSGRKVGVITHVAAMVERIAVQVRVEKLGGGLSQVSLQ